MIHIDGAYLYNFALAMASLRALRPSNTLEEAFLPTIQAHGMLNTFLHNSVYTIKTAAVDGQALLSSLEALWKDAAKQYEVGGDPTKQISHRYHGLIAALDRFETVLAAELRTADMYLVTPKGAYDKSVLIERGEALFPKELAEKAPLAIVDCKSAGRCIAFDLPTAAAFHLHRANETVLRRYFDVVTNGKCHPERRSIQAYVDALKGHQAGDKKILGALSALASFHRNPVLHPEQSLESIDDAIVLLGLVQTIVIAMLAAIPPPELKLEQSPGSVTSDLW